MSIVFIIVTCRNNQIITNYVFILIYAFKLFIAINLIQNKSFCLHNIWMCTVYIYYVVYIYKYKQTNKHIHVQYIFKCIYL